MSKNLFLQLCEELNVPHTRSFTNRTFDEHPYKYTLYGLSRMLSVYGVDSRGLRFEDKDAALSELEVPFVGQVSGDLSLVRHITDEEVTYHWYGEDITLPRGDFLHLWSGVALLADARADAGEPDLQEHRRAERIQHLKLWGAAGCIMLGVVAVCIWRALHLTAFPLLLFYVSSLFLNLAGLYVCYLLLQKQLHISSTTGDRLCNLLKQASCTNLLETPAAKVALGISWGEVGGAYFGVNVFTLLFWPSSGSVLALFAFCGVGFAVWSIWYQRFRAHSWCTLCLMVQGVILFQASLYLAVVLAYPSVRYGLSDVTVGGVLLLIAYLGSTLSLHLLLPIVSEARQARQWKYSFRNLKLREEVFEMLLHKEPGYAPAVSSSIRFGSPEARYHLTILTNPYCNPCAIMHRKMRDILQTSCSVEMVFTSFGPDYELVSRLMVAAYLQLGADRAWQLYDDWFNGGRERNAAFFDSVGLDADADFVVAEYGNHRLWREQTRLSATPTLLVNGYRMPKEYQIEDFIDLLKLEE